MPGDGERYNGLMKINILDTALALSDQDLLARLDVLSAAERETAAELVAHLAALELRPSLYAAQGYGSLFDYCTQVLKLSEDAACTRTRAARICRTFPIVLDLLSSGVVTLTALRLLQPHLTAENHEAVLARAAHRSCEEIKVLVAELAPQPDVPSSVRKLPSQPTAGLESRATLMLEGRITSVAVTDVPDGIPSVVPGPDSAGAATQTKRESGVPTPVIRQTVVAGRRSVVQALAPERFRVQFTIGQDTHDKLKRLQALMRREIPSGDVGVIFDQAVDLMLEKVERAKLGAKKRNPRWAGTRKNGVAYEERIRFETDGRGREGAEVSRPAVARVAHAVRRGVQPKPSRQVPNPVRRAVWWRDRGQCAFIGDTGHRCTQRAFLEIHHIHPYALDGPSTVDNLSLRCRRHNAYEAEVVFGPRPATPTETKHHGDSLPRDRTGRPMPESDVGFSRR